MGSSIETGLIQHHENLKSLIDNLDISRLEMDEKESNVITLDESFKNIFIILLIGIVTSFLAFLWEIIV